MPLESSPSSAEEPRLMFRVACAGVAVWQYPLPSSPHWNHTWSIPIPRDVALMEPLTLKKLGYDWLLESPVDDPFVLMDGTEVTCLGVSLGVSFHYGKLHFECISAEEETTLSGSVWTCLSCSRDIMRLPQGAHFCPRCGTRIPSTMPATSPVLPQTPRHSEMLKGFASAMDALGNRYETALGAANIESEAVRCYSKAAKLGNEHAVERLLAKKAFKKK
jgi:predicted RNA-binding Zn-ribbon protein involved in translation (DUF1610 family)